MVGGEICNTVKANMEVFGVGTLDTGSVLNKEVVEKGRWLISGGGSSTRIPRFLTNKSYVQL